MSIDAYRWLMAAPQEPMVKRDFLAAPAAGEVVVEIAGCGVCHTDLGYYYDGVRTNQPLPLALGHEISGYVVATGAGAEAWKGKAVIVPAVLPCGECDLCKRGLTTICRAQKMPGNDIQGGFASHIVVPARGLCPVDEARLAAALHHPGIAQVYDLQAHADGGYDLVMEYIQDHLVGSKRQAVLTRG
jgi:6-hydroxycyclohex-1-ene-1-carbonyl-CoA dehydrogenase